MILATLILKYLPEKTKEIVCYTNLFMSEQRKGKEVKEMRKIVMLLLIAGILLTGALSAVGDVFTIDAVDKMGFSNSGSSGNCINGGSTTNGGGGSGGGSVPG
jgi:uncharacterized membrane protein YgcG